MAGFFVHNGAGQNTVVPNAKCCSNPSVLCPKCAVAALGHSHTSNEAAHDGGLVVNGPLPWFVNAGMASGLTENEATAAPLPRPTLNAADDSPIGPGGVRKDGDADDVEAATRRRWGLN